MYDFLSDNKIESMTFQGLEWSDDLVQLKENLTSNSSFKCLSLNLTDNKTSLGSFLHSQHLEESALQ